MLKKLEYYYNEDGEKIDITDEKIYWDTQKNQFRHKFECFECGKPVNCMCYDELEETLMCIEEGMICTNCGFDRAIDGDTVYDLYKLLDTERRATIAKLAISLLSTDEQVEILETIVVNKNNGFDYDDLLDMIEDERIDHIREEIINLLTDDEKLNHFYECCDIDTVGGYVCEV